MKWLENIFKVNSVKLKPMHIKKIKNTPSYYNPHLQTTSSTTFKVLAKPTVTGDKQNTDLNERLGLVKKMMEESPVFKKFLDDEFILFVKTVTNIDGTSKRYYQPEWEKLGEKPRPVIPLHDIFTTVFKLIVNKPNMVQDDEKIFIIKVVRCYITEAIEGKQDYKLPVDKWDAEYCKEEEGEDGEMKNELEARQKEI